MLLNDIRYSWRLRSGLDRAILTAALALTAALFALLCAEMCAPTLRAARLILNPKP